MMGLKGCNWPLRVWNKTMKSRLNLLLAIGIGLLPFNLPLSVFASEETATSTAGKQRLISLAPHITELLFAIGAGDEIVGSVSYSDFPEQAKDIPRIGSYDKINYEAVMAKKPTLVVGWNSGNGEESITRLRELGINVYSHELKTLEDVAESLVILGELTGHASQGKKRSESFLSRLQGLRDQYSALKPVKLYYQLWNEPQMTVNDDHLISDVIRLCGGENIFYDAVPLVPKVSVESVLRRSPEVIIATGMAGERPEWLDDWKQWAFIPAVKNEQLYHIHPDLLHRHSPRILEGAEQLCVALNQARAVN